MQQGARDAAKNYRMNIVLDVSYPFTATVNAIDETVLFNIVSQLKALNPDGVVLATGNCQQFLQYISRADIDYTPRWIALI